MFVHAPEQPETVVTALVLWDHAGLAHQALDMCRAIERRSDEVKFRIEAADAADLERRAEELGAKACAADLVLVALEQSLHERSEEVKKWFSSWSSLRSRHAGALAVLRPPDVAGPEQPFTPDATALPPGTEEEENFRHFLEHCASQARMELFWRCLESELEEATVGMRILEAA